MGYTAVGMSGLDLPKYNDMSKTGTVESPFISLNVADANQAQVCLPYQEVKIGAYNIGITAITGKDFNSGLNVIEWRDAISSHITSLKSKFDFIILLSDLSIKENKIIANSFPEIQVIISNDPKINNLSPSMVNRTIITQTKPLGQFLGVLKINLSPEITWKSNYFSLNNLYVKNATIKHKIAKLEKQGNAPGEVVVLKDELKEIPGQIKALKKQLPKQAGSSFSVEFIPITTEFLEDAVIQNIVK